jgi:phosphonate degradation associated HDIG domain protein
MDKIETIINLFQEKGNANYIGENISQREHAEQCAQLAAKETDDDEVVLAAFLHDIGHICVESNEDNNMSGFGIKSHEKIGADFLRNLGVTERIATLIEGHVQAKRYLTYAQPNYYNQLSEASQQTLEFQGGIMTPFEALEFEEHPDFLVMIRLREWDDAAKEIGIPLEKLSKYEDMLKRVLAKS